MKNGKFVAKLGLVAVLSVCAGLASAQAKKTLVYCSEASPEGFSPQLYTTGTTFDASASPLFNRLVEFELGTTTIKPALAESWTISDDGTVYTFKLRKGVKFHSNTKFKPSRDFNADDVVFTLIAWATLQILTILWNADRLSVTTSIWVLTTSSTK